MNKFRNPEAYRYSSFKSKSLFEKQHLIDILPPFQPWPFSKPVSWSKPCFEDRTWQLYFYSLGWLNLFVSSEKIERFEDAKNIILSISDFLLDNPSDDAKMYWFDHATALRASHISYIYNNFIWKLLDTSEKEIIIRVLGLHLRKLSNYILSSTWENNNHTIFHAEAIIDVANCEQILTANQKRLYRRLATESLEALFENIFEPDEGICIEQSFFYHQFDAELLYSSIEFMRLNDIEVSYGSTDLMQKIYDFIWLIAPYETGIPSVGDTAFNSHIDKKRMSSISRMLGKSYIEEYILNAQNARRPRAINNFQNSGYVVFFGETYNENKNLVVNSAVFIEKKKREPHGHFDGNSFTVSSEGEPIVIDSGGPYKYGDPLRYKYFISQLAHNTLIVDSKPREFFTTIKYVKSAYDVHGVLGICTLDKLIWKRIFLSIQGKAFYCLDIFKNEGKNSRQIDILLHLNREIRILSYSKENILLKSKNGKRVTVSNYSNVDFENHFLSASCSQDPRFPSYQTSAIGEMESTMMQRISTRSGFGWVGTMIEIDGDSLEVEAKLSVNDPNNLSFDFSDHADFNNFSLKVCEDSFDIVKETLIS